MTPGDPIRDMSAERIRLLLERDFIARAAKQQLCAIEDFQVVRAFRLLQGGTEPGNAELAQFGVSSQGDAELIEQVMREADRLAKEDGQ